MKEEDIAEFRDLLLRLKKQLAGNVNHMQHEALHEWAGMRDELSDMPFEHMADRGSESFAQEMILNILQNSEAELADVENALDKIEDGTYGICENCNEAIPRARLKALPFARLCIACKQEEEAALRAAEQG
jgi:RNA polymerase-binding protein DksA